jgi:hypothetical protein
MNQDEYHFLASEIEELESILADIPADRVIDRMSFDARLKNAREELARVDPAQFPKKARLTFLGGPVFGTHSIEAEFAATASNLFTEAYAAIVAGLGDNLPYMEPIPDKQKNQLALVGTAIGPFGFEYELPVPQRNKGSTQTKMDLGLTDKAKDAMLKLKALFRLASEGSDDDLSELVDEIHPRAVEKAVEFLKHISEKGAWCGLEFNDSSFRFSNSDQVRSSAARLDKENIKEGRESFSGAFVGALPVQRTFEFKLNDQTKILCGKIGPEIMDATPLNQQYLYKPINVTLRVMQIGQGRPRYTLQKLEDIKL